MLSQFLSLSIAWTIYTMLVTSIFKSTYEKSCTGFIKLWSAFPAFQVSQYTGRIHLYSCIPGTDLRPRPLFENFRPEELDLLNSQAAEDNKGATFKSFKDNPAYRHVLLAFVNEWNELRPIDRRKLVGKPLQLPLTVELSYLSEGINHNNGVCLIKFKLWFFCGYFCIYELVTILYFSLPGTAEGWKQATDYTFIWD